ncbi:MAG TPA: uracil-DNA glycosylase [Dehalococcoidia bacterium]|nr:uracil-DNA glycosylase [Dehalococcoidia bacterium]
MSTEAVEGVDRRRALASIAKQIALCRECALARGATNPVPGEGSAEAEIVFIGEGPGFYEDQQGRPFVGASGKFLDELLRSIGLDRRKVFITNIVKHRPPNNRDPLPEEISACRRFLDEQLAAIQPKVIVTLGRHSLQRYFPGESIGRIHGQPRRKDGFIVVPMYHPAAALHQQSLRRVIEADFQKLPSLLARALGGEASAAEAPPVAPRPAAAPAPAPVAAAPAADPEAQQMRLL